MEIIERVVEKLAPVIEEEVSLHLNADEKAQTLADKLMEIRLLLDDAERQQLSRLPVKKWLSDLQNLAYDIEDALEEWEAQNQELQEEASNLSPTITWKEKVCLFLHYPCSCFKEVVDRRTKALNIKGLNESVERMYSKGVGQLQLNQLLTGSIVSDKGESGGSCSNNWRSTTSDFVKSEVHGRETDKINVKKMLLPGDCPENKDDHEVICIVGSGGLGKTTLAKMIYDDDEVKLGFPMRIWICVSEPFNKFNIAKDIYEQLMDGCSPSNFTSTQALHKEIKKLLREKSLQENSKFLLVLDDVWTEDSEVWKPLYACLCEGGAKGSKILVTTRKGETAEAMGASKRSSYPLGQMTDEQCWSIIQQTALYQRDDVDCRRFERVGLEIARKCNGSPLAASFLGGHLKDKLKVQQWEKVLKNEVWELDNVEEKLFRHFFLSYNELNPTVKQCFAYCAVFPKDYKIDVEYLIKIWMAQGFLSSSETTSDDQGDGMETKGYDVFKDLANRSFFQDLERDDLGERVVECKMHDIVHDFARYLSTNARHLWWDHKLQQSGPISDAGKLRSLFCRGGLPTADIVGCLKRVRMLSLCGCGLENIPAEIGKLIHLRYLDLSWNDMRELPETIYNLCNLQTLVLNGCSYLSRLPKGISKLRKLRYLISLLDEYPPEIASLTNLRVFKYLYVREGFNDLRYLKDLNQLGGFLVIKLRQMDDVEAAETAALQKKTSLDDLTLDYDEGVALQVVEALQPHPHLQTLSIQASGVRFPSWITILENLKRLKIYCRGWETIDCSSWPLWKLPSLEYLRISGDVDRWVGNAFNGLISSAIDISDDDTAINQLSFHHQKPLVVFPALRTLELRFGDNWRAWNDMEEKEEAAITSNNIIIMPRLTHLGIHRCKKLETLPHRALQQLPSLQTLHVVNCPELANTYDYGFTDVLQSYIPNVVFDF